MNTLIEKTEKYVREVFANSEGSHDWHHIDRVRRLACYLAEQEGADLFLVEMAALMHDLDDRKYHIEGMPANRSETLLKKLEVDSADATAILQIISEVSYRGAGVETPVSSSESAVVQDADRLDAIGAIGIGRAFAYGGSRGRALYHPEETLVMHDHPDQYYSSRNSTIAHFYEKLLLLKDRLHTDAARKVADDRHAFMLRFLDQFYAEWNFGSSSSQE